MSSIEIIILCVTGAIACITYIVKHFKTSSCWTKESCCMCKMDLAPETPAVSINGEIKDKVDGSKSEVVIKTHELHPTSYNTPNNDDSHYLYPPTPSSSNTSSIPDEKADSKIHVSSVV